MSGFGQRSVVFTVFFISSVFPALLHADCSCSLTTASRITRDRFIEDYAKSSIIDLTGDETAYILNNIVQSGGVTKTFNLTALLANYTDNLADFVLNGGMLNMTWGNVTDRALNVMVYGLFGKSWTVGLADYLGSYSRTLETNIRKMAGDYSYPLGTYRPWNSRSYGYSCLSSSSSTPQLCTRWPWDVHRFEISLLARAKIQLTWNSAYNDWSRPYSSLLVTDIELAVDNYLSAVYNQSYIQSTFDRCNLPDCRYFNMTLYFSIPYDSSLFPRLNTSLYEMKVLQLRYLNTTLDLEPKPDILKCYKGLWYDRCYTTPNDNSSNNAYGTGATVTTTTDWPTSSAYMTESTTLTQSIMTATTTTTAVSLEATETTRDQTEISKIATETAATDDVGSTINNSSESTEVQSTENSNSPETIRTTLSSDSTFSTVTEPSSTAIIPNTSLATDTSTTVTLISTSISAPQSTLTTHTSGTPPSVKMSTNTNTPITGISSTLTGSAGTGSSVPMVPSQSSPSVSTSSYKESSRMKMSSPTVATVRVTIASGQPVTIPVPNPFFAQANWTSFPVFQDEPTFYAKVPVIRKVYNDPVLLKRFEQLKIFITTSSYFYTITIPVALVLLAVSSLCLYLLQKDWLGHEKTQDIDAKPDLKF